MANGYLAVSDRLPEGAHHFRISWGAIFAGTFVSLLTYFILVSLGLGIGGDALVDIVRQGSNAGGLSVGAGIWSLVSALIALFVGAYFGGRVGGIIPGRIGLVQGLVVCALFFGFLFSQIGAGISLAGRGIGSTVGAVGTAAGSVADNPQVQSVVQDSLGDLNLRSDPKTVASGVTSRLIRGDATGARDYLATQAGISPTEAQARIDRFRTQFDTTVRNIGVEASKILSGVGWVLFVSMLLGAIAAAFGGSFGARRNLRAPLSDRDRDAEIPIRRGAA